MRIGPPGRVSTGTVLDSDASDDFITLPKTDILIILLEDYPCTRVSLLYIEKLYCGTTKRNTPPQY